MRGTGHALRAEAWGEERWKMWEKGSEDGRVGDERVESLDKERVEDLWN